MYMCKMQQQHYVCTANSRVVTHRQLAARAGRIAGAVPDAAALPLPAAKLYEADQPPAAGAAALPGQRRQAAKRVRNCRHAVRELQSLQADVHDHAAAGLGAPRQHVGRVRRNQPHATHTLGASL